MRIVIDANMPLGREFFSTVGEVLAVPPRDIERDQLINADALVVRSVKKITAAMIEGTALQFIGTCTAGFDHLDTEAIEAMGKHWCNAPGSNANSVVEYVVSALSALEISWLKATIGIVGCGQVGGRLHQRLKALGINCHCYDPFLSPENNADLGEFEQLLDCDIICLHTPYTTSGLYPTHHLLNSDNLKKLKTGAVLINAGRGGVVDNTALLGLLKQRSDLRCVMDVWENEPDINQQLIPLVDIATPHIAGHSVDGKMKGTAMVYTSLCEFFDTKPRTTLRELDNPPQLPEIVIAEESIETAIRQATLTAYNIAQDSRRWLADIASKGDIATSFDQFRKSYPVRREFFHYKIKLSKQNADISRALSTLGFQV